MPDIFDILIPQQVNDILPIKERTSPNKSILSGLLSGFNYLWQLFLSFKRGADVQLSLIYWAVGSYSIGDKVIYPPSGEVYEVIVPTTSTEPSTSPDWKKVLNSFIGTDERQNYDGSFLSLTYALNRQYQTAFQDDPDVLLSTIYLEIQPQTRQVFRVGLTEQRSTSIGLTKSSQFIMSSYNLTTVPAFIIKVPGFRFPTFGPSDEKLIRSFVDQYLPFGVEYEIEDY